MKNLIVFSSFLALFSVGIFGQNKCFTKEESSKVIESIKVPAIVSENKELRRELLKMVEVRNKLNQKIAENTIKNQTLIIEFNKLGESQLLRLCQIVKEKGWLTKDLVKEDGVNAMLSIIRNNRAYKLQAEFYPVLIEAANKRYIEKGNVAAIIDSVRVGTNQPQIFGTQAKIRDNVIYIHPLLNEEKVNEWRKQYEMPPLSAFIKELELRYFLPVIKSPLLPIVPKLKNQAVQKGNETLVLGISNEDDEVLKIDTKLVNLNVRILKQDFSIPLEVVLKKEDFMLLEDGQEQEVSFFSSTESPFDLVLLLDFSGSTKEKQGLIKEAAQRFIEVARPNDRIAVVVFTEQIVVISNLTADKGLLINEIKKIETSGGSRVWGALKFVYSNIIKRESIVRRNAVVFMTDGIDNSIDTTFTDLFEIVRNGDTTIFPVYLDSEESGNEWTQRRYFKARQSLWLLAEESGGTAYRAKKAKDLRGIYEQIVNDIGRVYSIGYEPKNENQDGGWRSLVVKIKTRPDLIARTRRGYYAK